MMTWRKDSKSDHRYKQVTISNFPNNNSTGFFAIIFPYFRGGSVRVDRGKPHETTCQPSRKIKQKYSGFLGWEYQRTKTKKSFYHHFS